MHLCYTDKYFTKTYNVVAEQPPVVVTYGVFLRHQAVCAVQPALEFLQKRAPGVTIFRHYEEGEMVAPETPIFSYQGVFDELVEIETQLLQRVGFACLSAFNAYMMCSVYPTVPFLDMAARHCAPDAGDEGMIKSCAYGASVGSKAAQLDMGARGFIGSSLDLTAPFYGAASGLGTMPHALIGMYPTTLDALKDFVKYNPDDKTIVALVDFFGTEYTDALDCAIWFKTHGGEKTLGVRLDTHGGRFAEGLDYESSINIVSEWLNIRGKWPIVSRVMGEHAFDLANDAIRDDIAKILFGTGVSVASIIHMRRVLNTGGYRDVQIVVSSGFNVRKCRVMNAANAPIDMIGTGSFLPETLNETYATCDAYGYNGEFRVKVGREKIFREAAKLTLSSRKP